MALGLLTGNVLAIIDRPMDDDRIRAPHVMGPLGEHLSLKMLPSPLTKRWVARRKAEVVVAVEGGLLTLDEACERYNLSLQEFAAWQRGMDRAGLAGLCATKAQHYRDGWNGGAADQSAGDVNNDYLGALMCRVSAPAIALLQTGRSDIGQFPSLVAFASRVISTRGDKPWVTQLSMVT